MRFGARHGRSCLIGEGCYLDVQDTSAGEFSARKVQTIAIASAGSIALRARVETFVTDRVNPAANPWLLGFKSSLPELWDD